MATVVIHLRDGSGQGLTELDADQVADLARTVVTGKPETFTFTGQRNGAVTEHQTSDVMRLEVVPERADRESAPPDAAVGVVMCRIDETVGKGEPEPPAAELPAAWADLFEGLTLLAKHRSDDVSPFHCQHDTLFVMADTSQFTDEEVTRLEELGFHVDKGNDTVYSYRYGSA